MILSRPPTIVDPPPPTDYPAAFDYFVDPNLPLSSIETYDGLSATVGAGHGPWSLSALYTKGTTYSGKVVGIKDGATSLNAGGQRSLGTALSANGNWIDIPSWAVGATVAAINPRKAKLYETTFPQFAHYYMRIRADNFTLRGLRFSHGACQGIDVSGVQNTRISDCQFDDLDCGRITGFGSTNFGAIRTSRVGSGPSTVATAVRNLTVENNYFADIKNVRLGLPDNDPSRWGNAIGQLFSFQGLTARRNTAVRVAALTANKRDTGNMLVERNLVLSAHCAMVYMLWQDSLSTDGDDQFATTPTIVRNNVFSDIQAFTNNTGETNQNWWEAQLYNNTLIFRNDGVTNPLAGSGAFMVWNNGLQANVLAPYPVANAKHYNNILAFAAPAALNNPWEWIYPTAGQSLAALFAVRNFNVYQSLKLIDKSNGITYSTLAALQALGLDMNSIVAAHGLLNPTTAVSADYALQAGAAGLNFGRVGGVIGGAAVHAGALDGVVSSVGCDFLPEA